MLISTWPAAKSGDYLDPDQFFLIISTQVTLELGIVFLLIAGQIP